MVWPDRQPATDGGAFLEPQPHPPGAGASRLNLVSRLQIACSELLNFQSRAAYQISTYRDTITASMQEKPTYTRNAPRKRKIGSESHQIGQLSQVPVHHHWKCQTARRNPTQRRTSSSALGTHCIPTFHPSHDKAEGTQFMTNRCSVGRTLTIRSRRAGMLLITI